MSAPDKMWRETISPNPMYKEGGSFYHETKPEREGLVEYTRSDLILPASADCVAGLRAASARCKLEAESLRQHGYFRNAASELYFDSLTDAQIIIDRLADEALPLTFTPAELLAAAAELPEVRALVDALEKADQALHDDGCRPTMWPRPQIAAALAPFARKGE